jgi:hypothetical protein
VRRGRFAGLRGIAPELARRPQRRVAFNASDRGNDSVWLVIVQRSVLSGIDARAGHASTHDSTALPRGDGDHRVADLWGAKITFGTTGRLFNSLAS